MHDTAMYTLTRLQVFLCWWCLTGVTWSAEETLDIWRRDDKLNNELPWLWKTTDFPQPRNDPVNCRRPRPSFVCDPDQILPREQADNLDFMIERIRNETECVCARCLENRPEGITIGVAIMKHIMIPYNTVRQKVITEFAQDLRKKWRIGACDNDIVIVIVTMDKLLSTSVGSMLTGSMDMLEASDRIVHETREHFMSEHYYEGLESMIQSYFDVIRRQQNLLARAARSDDDTARGNVGLIVGLVVGGLVLIAIIMIVSVFMFRRKKWSDKFEFDSEKASWRQGQPVKNFPPHSDAVYAPCSVEEPDVTCNGAKTGVDEGDADDVARSTMDTENIQHVDSETDADTSEAAHNGTTVVSSVPPSDIHNTSEA